MGVETETANIIKAEVPELKNVWDHEKKDAGPLPAAMIFWDGYPEVKDTASHVQYPKEAYIIRVITDLQDAKKAQADMKTIVPKIIKALQKNRNLNSTCMFSQVIKADNKFYMELGEMNCEILLHAVNQSYDT